VRDGESRVLVPSVAQTHFLNNIVDHLYLHSFSRTWEVSSSDLQNAGFQSRILLLLSVSGGRTCVVAVPNHYGLHGPGIEHGGGLDFLHPSSTALGSIKPPIHRVKGKETGNVHPITGHEDLQGQYRFSSTLSLTSVLDGVGGQRHAPADLPIGMIPGTDCVGGWVGPSPCLDGYGKSRPHRETIPEPSNP
jgi:hypothetical protein